MSQDKPNSQWKRVVFDIETDNLLEKLTRVHCLVLKDMDSGEILSCTDSAPGYTPIQTGLDILSNAEKIFGHNIIAFDVPALKKVYPKWTTQAAEKDTYIIAAMRYAHIKALDFANPKFPKQFAGRHSLEAWGHRLALHKTDYLGWCKENGIEDPWAEWRPQMQAYCVDDVELTHVLVRSLAKAGIPPEAVETELELRRLLVDMERLGWPFDFDAAIALQGALAERRQELAQELRKMFGSWQQYIGTFVPKRDNKRLGYIAGFPVDKYRTVEFNPASRQHIANRLMEIYGWKPENYTDKGEIIVDESVLNTLDYPPIPLLIEYLTIDKRLGQLAEGREAWLKHVVKNPNTGMVHIHGRVNQNGTITHRASHSNPNLAQVPKVGSIYGAECRALFTVPDGWVQIGADASGLEARCLGHFVAKYDDGAYAEILLRGDVHTKNREALELPDGVDEDGQKYRDRAKTWYYAWMFGAGDKKLGKTHSPKSNPSKWAKIGKKYKTLFLKATPALALLVTAVQKRAKKPGFIEGLDGRRVYIRSEHAALNTLIQSAGAVICKRWLYLISKDFRKRFGEPSWDGKWVPLGWIHDELQIAVRPEIADEVMALCVTHIESLTEHFKFRCPLSGEAKMGKNWKDTH